MRSSPPPLIHTPFDEGSDPESPGNAVCPKIEITVGQHPVLGDHVEGSDLPELIDQCFRDAVGHVGELTIQADVLEVEDRDAVRP